MYHDNIVSEPACHQTSEKMSEPTLLLTGTIDSGVFGNTGNKIRDIEQRLSQYDSAISKYITQSVFHTIVFAENSGYPLQTKKYTQLAEQCGKVFEYLPCPSYVDETVAKGKSYGEARLIEDALHTSKRLKDSTTIYKITGRIFLKNSREICKTSAAHANEFLVYNRRQWCFTNIFKFNYANYEKFWNRIWESCDESLGFDIEKVFFQVLKNNAAELDIGSFRVWPELEGIQGATLQPYTGSRTELYLRTVLCKLGCFTFGSPIAKVLRM